jgi:hypothetical protein
VFRQRGVAVELRDVRCVSTSGATADVDRNCRDSLCARACISTLVALARRALGSKMVPSQPLDPLRQ